MSECVAVCNAINNKKKEDMNGNFRGVILSTGSKFASGKPQMSLDGIDGFVPEI
jgi:hypothetical protein